MRKLVIGVAAILAFTLAAIAAIWALTGPGLRAPAGAPPAAPPPVAVAIPPAPGAAPPSLPPPPPEKFIVEYGPARVEPPKGSWEAVAVAARPAALGPVGVAIARGLNDVDTQLAACFDEDTAARYGAQPRSVSKDASLGDTGTPVLMLHIETGGGRARIVDAPVETQGGVGDGVIACAQSVLRGRSFPLPDAPAGGKYRLLYALTP